MRLLHVVHTYAPAIGGTQWMVQQISERLNAHYGDEVTVFTTVAYNNAYFWNAQLPAMKAGTALVNGIRVKRFPVFNRFGTVRLNMARLAHKLHLPGEDWLRGLYFGPIVPGLTQAIARSGAELVLASAFPLIHMHNAVAGARKANIPSVLLGAFHPEDRWGFNRQMIYKAIQQCSLYVAYTTFERDHLIAHGIEPAKIRVIGGGVEPSDFANINVASIRQQLGWGESPIIATVAQHVAHKRIDLLIKAMDTVWASLPDARLAIIGSRTAYSENLEALVRAYPPDKQNQIEFFPHCTDIQKANLLAACDVFALLSSYESFGLVFLEAWSCGKPVVGVNVGAIPSVIEDNVDGLLVPPNNVLALAQALIRLLREPGLRNMLGAKGLAKVRSRYCWDAIIPQIRSAYLEALQRDQTANRGQF